MSGLADVIVERLRAAGTRALFGVPGGGGNLDLIDAARGVDLPFVLTSTETGAAIAAIAQAEVLGKPGACLTTLGPGAASVVNGVACALLDRAPIAVFTDSNPLGAAGRFTHQQLDHVALFSPITRWSGRLTPDDAGRVLDRAFLELSGLPPGPVHVDCPGDVSAAPAGPPVAERSSASGGRTARRDASRSSAIGPHPAAPDPSHRAAPEAPAALDQIVSHARKPLLIIGLGARAEPDAAAIRHLCARWHVPAMVTYKAKGVIPDAHASFAGVFTNGAIERALVAQSDALIGIGLDPVELLPRPWSFPQPVVGVNRWRAAGDHVPFAAEWVTDIAHATRMIEARMRPSEWDLDEVARTVHGEQRFTDIPASGMTAQHVVDAAAGALAATSRVTVDAGAHMLPAMLRWPVREPNHLLISNGLSTMGFALPAAIGAALADRAQRVVALTGDGGLLMCAGELLTAAREKLRILTIVFNDASLSLIEIKQQARRLPPAGVALGPVNWAALAESVGVAGFAASTARELARAIDRAAAHDGPSLIDARIDRSNYGRMLHALRG